MQRATCTGCGAEIVLEEGEAQTTCAFCGRALVRKNYVNADNMPELVVPFSITKDEASQLLADWCKKNKWRREARTLREKCSELKGFYLPYELIRGPIECQVCRVDGGNRYKCGGYVDEVFVNCSKNLDNQLLDAMEPYNLEELEAFDFAYVAGQRVKVGDIPETELKRRINHEVAVAYTPTIQKTLETKVVSVGATSNDVEHMPVLLPVYYLAFDGYMAAVNGQTGKVSVRAIRDSYYFIVPWWVKAIVGTVVSTGAIVLIMFLCGAAQDLILGTSMCLLPLLLIVLLVAYSDYRQSEFRVDAERKVFTSKGGPCIRENGTLVQAKEELKRETTPPVFCMDIEHRRRAVELQFTSPLRVLKTIGITGGVVFFPVILALFINGFHFSQIELGGSAPWFCISVPLAPILLLKYGRMELYDNPWIYLLDEEGGKKRYKPKPAVSVKETIKEILKEILPCLYKPPACFLAWFIIAIFCGMVYLTAFGFE